MLSIAHTFTLDGISARPVRVEVDVHRGLPGFAIIGLPDAAVRETRERVHAALLNCGFEFPLRRIVVNVAPAGRRRAAPGMDLAIAAGLLRASAQLDWPGSESVALVGELGLDGRVRPIQGLLPIAEAAREHGAREVVVPADNAPEAALAGGIDVVAISTLRELPALAAGEKPFSPSPLSLSTTPSAHAPDMVDLRGHRHLRRALEVAAAGGHSLLMVGPPGAGRSLAAVRLPSILPPLTEAEALEVARIASATGRLGAGVPAGRPFPAPHHTVSTAGLIGGGTPSRPGEVTLAHRGLLFLDEVTEFRRDALEALWGPLESGEVSIARAGRRCRLPARFMLVAASNPCPCGRGEGDPDCTCLPRQVRRHQARLDGAPADRIDLTVGVAQPSAEEIGGAPGESSAAVRDRVCAARERQEARLGAGRCNAQMTRAEVGACDLDPVAVALLADHHRRHRLGGRAHERVLRLARTIADLTGSVSVEEDQLIEALGLRGRTGVAPTTDGSQDITERSSDAP